MADISKDEFIKAVTSDLPTPPPYFFKDAKINITGYDSFETMLSRELKGLSVDEFLQETKNGALILDTRPAEEFEKGFIPNSINIGLNGDFASWLGSVINFSSNIVLVTLPGQEKESIIRMSRIGYESVKGFLKGGFNEWVNSKQAIGKIESISTAKAEETISSNEYILLDVRKSSEREQSFIKNSIFISLSELPAKIDTLNKDKKYLVYCAGGYRSMIASSILLANGFKNISNLQGGINKLKLEKPLLMAY